jgi:hypothetical protein
MPLPVLQILPGQSELIKHCFEQPGSDLLPAILQGRESVAIVEPSVATFAMPAIERDKYPAMMTDPSDFPLKFVAIHRGIVAQICANFNKPIRPTSLSIRIM